MNWIERLLRKTFKFKEIGWREIGEEFTRYQLVKTSKFNVYLHQLYCPNWHDKCHDHPWDFITLILWNGYLEQIDNRYFSRVPGQFLYREANFTHSVLTPSGVSWSLVITGPKCRDWQFKDCE